MTTIIKSPSNWLDIKQIPSNFPNPCAIFVDTPNEFISEIPNIYIQVEPNQILNIEKYLIDNYQKYYKIYTWNSNVLNKIPNSVKYIPATTWLSTEFYNNINIDIDKNKYKISFASGHKNTTSGHKLRHLIYKNQMQFANLPIIFYRFSAKKSLPNINNNPVIGSTRENRYEIFKTYQFSFVIENTTDDNNITEKLIDCLLSKTIPIYYGCSNISDIFDTTGWIIISTDNIDEIENKLKMLSPNYYKNYINIINSNYEIAKEYTNFYKNLEKSN